MSTKVLSLFGEEIIIPEQVNAVGRSRAVAKEKPAEKKPEKKKPEPKEKTVKVKEKPAPKKKAMPGGRQAAKEENKPGILAGWQPDKQYYSIGEVASLFGVATSHIRFWTNEFELRVRTTRKGDRLYSPELVNELRVIYNLVKEKGYTISGAKARLKDDKKAPPQALDLKHSLLQLRNKLLQIRNQI
jgi:DNA-binding transcriptional MerR regulator